MARRKLKNKRRFAGKLFKKSSKKYRSKRSAKAAGKGKYFRVVKRKGGYSLFTRKAR